MQNDQKQRRTVLILATGGTIAGTGKEGKTTGYTPGGITVEDLIRTVPHLTEAADVIARQICSINSDDVDQKIWRQLADAIDEHADDDEIAGFVITHGTDTLEETAYFLNLVLKTDKPVVITGSMRPATSTSPDGPMNLYQAVLLAASDEAVGKGVLVVFSDKIFSARGVLKSSTYSVTTMSGGDEGALGVIREDVIQFYNLPAKKHTVSTEFSTRYYESLPHVSVIYFHAEADTGLLEYALNHSDGIVIAGAGAGEYDRHYRRIIEHSSVPVVISSRINTGIITRNDMMTSNTIPANGLSPQKAAILLKLALTKTNDRRRITEIFNEY